MKSTKKVSPKVSNRSKSPGYNRITAHSYLNATSFRLRNIQNDLNDENPLKFLIPNRDDLGKDQHNKSCMSIFSYGKLPKIKNEDKFTPLYKSKIMFFNENYKSNYIDKNSNNQPMKKDSAKSNKLKQTRNISCFFPLNKIGLFTNRLLHSKVKKDKENSKNNQPAMKKSNNELKDSSSISTSKEKKRNKKYHYCLNSERKQMMIAHEEKDKKKKGKSKSINCFFQLMYPNNILKTIKGKSQPGRNEGRISKINQDSFLIMTLINNIIDFNVFAVFDGHGVNGHLVSEFAKNHFKQYILNHKEISLLKLVDEIYLKLTDNDYSLVKNMFKMAEKELLLMNFDSNFSGTTCVIVFHLGFHIICANVGDSRAIMVELFDEDNKQYQIIPLSYDQKPQNVKERKRIEKAGGRVEQYSGMK